MKKHLKKVISVILVVTLCLSLVVPTYAISNDIINTPITYTQEIDGGYLFYVLTDTQSISILTNTDENIIELNIVNLSEKTKVNQFILRDYPIIDANQPLQLF